MKFSLRIDDATDILFSVERDAVTATPFVMVGDKRFESLADLVKAHPQLAEQKSLPTYCSLCTHFHNQGVGYLLIEDVQEYRARYLALVAYGEVTLSDVPTTADFGPYDVTELAPPRIADDKLIYYVEDAMYSVPYRVEAPWPANRKEPVCIQLLPLAE